MEIFQTFEYSGRILQLATYEPVPSPKPAKAPFVRAPGAGKFKIGQINLSATEIVAGEALTFTAQITGKNIAYIYTEILLKDKTLNQFYGPVAHEYIQADRDKEAGGVSHPNWSDAINLSIRLSLGLHLLTDGVNSAFAFASPEGYSILGCRLDGQYTSAEGQYRARILFDGDGNIKEILAFKEQKMKSLPHALTPKPGDTFAPFVQVLTPSISAAENEKWESATALSTPLTFSDRPFQLITEAPMPAEYLVGILIQDLDGGFTRKYVPLTIK